MCTVTFLPGKDEGFILTSNRDEQAIRKKADPPRKFEVSKQTVFFPKDKQAGGTWIATSVNGFTLCLLNGAYVRHERELNYRMSRGLVLLDFFKFNNIHQFASDYSFVNIEPFTLIVVDGSDKRKLFKMIWDGEKTDVATLDQSQPHVWSSVTLYDKEVIDNRRQWFKEWLELHPLPELDDIVKFHETGGSGDERNNLVMNREGKLFTVSITAIRKSDEGIYMMYKDLPENKRYQVRVI